MTSRNPRPSRQTEHSDEVCSDVVVQVVPEKTKSASSTVALPCHQTAELKTNQVSTEAAVLLRPPS